MRWVALMPLRGGSKSIPRKNLRRIAGRPLFAWSLEAAVASRCFDTVFVATDCEEIGAAVRSLFGAAVQVIERSPETATDTASSESVMLELQEREAFDVIALVQATSPLTRAEDFRAARKRFLDERCDSLLTAVELRRFVWTRDGRPLNYEPARRPRRQDIEGLMLENGAFYLTRAEILREHRSRLGGRIGIQPMDPETAVEVDEPHDWETVARLLARRHARRCFEGRVVRGFVTDVDGTLTDGGMYYDAGGERLKKFQTRDAQGLALLRARGVRVAVVSAERSPAVAARMAKLDIAAYFDGVGDKLAMLERLAARWGARLDDIVYVGDDVNDLEALAAAGCACCPADAVPAVLACADYVCARPGGAGAVREVCDLLLELGRLPG